jgi:signal transduction histidine kinase
LRDSHKSVVCWVQDTGTGIETERLTKIFDNSETDQQPHKRGSGLGLAIVESRSFSQLAFNSDRAIM